jgi:zinc finger RNA-binding protein
MDMQNRFSSFDDDKPVGEEYIDEWKNPRTGAVSYYCILCGCQFDSKLIVTHAKGRGHKQQYQTYKERETTDDRLVLTKHCNIAVTKSEYELVSDMVVSCEKALKLVSDNIAQSSTAKKSAAEGPPPRAIRGVMRSGLLASGLLLAGEIHVVLVVLTTDKPTKALLKRVADDLPKHLEAQSKKRYEVTVDYEEASIFVTAVDAPKPSCKIMMTSALMRTHPFHYYNEIAPPDPEDVLPRVKCEEALRGLRRARWFEAKAWTIPYSDIVVRIFRDLCERVPTWKPISLWMLQILVQKCLSTVDGGTLSPSYAVQLVFECIASGILLPDSPGLYDPCEREPTDLCQVLTPQEREYITASAQHALRLITFDQLHKILGMSENALRIARSAGGGNKRRHPSIEELAVTSDGKKSRINTHGVDTTG